MAVTLTPLEPGCSLSNGEVSTQVVGGVPPFSYLWSTGETTASISGVPEGTYSVTVTDNSGCSTSTSIDLVSLSMQLSSSITMPLCGDPNGAIDLSINGGMSPYTYTWSTGETSEDLQSVPPGDYTVEVFDSNNCSITETFILSSNLMTVTASILHPSCGSVWNGEIDVQIDGGNPPYSYSWNTNQTTEDLLGLTPGQYSLTVSDMNGCNVTETFELIREEPAFSVSNIQIINPSCNGARDGSIIYEINGGNSSNYDFLWSTGETTLNRINLPAGSYSVMIQGSGGCSITQEFELIDPDITEIPGIQSGYNICSGSDLTLTTDTPYEMYQWSSSNGFTSNENYAVINQVGTYNLVTEDRNGCTFSKEFDVFQNSTSISTDFIRSTEATTQCPVVFINLTTPQPDSIHWLINDPDVNIVNTSDSEAAIEFSSARSYKIGIRAFLNGCSSDIVRSVEIGSSGTRCPEEETDNQLLEFSLSPNPNNGIFTVSYRSDGDGQINGFLVWFGRWTKTLYNNPVRPSGCRTGLRFLTPKHWNICFTIYS